MKNVNEINIYQQLRNAIYVTMKTLGCINRNCSKVLYINSKKKKKNKLVKIHFSQRYIMIINVPRFAFFDFDISSQNSKFVISVIF